MQAKRATGSKMLSSLNVFDSTELILYPGCVGLQPGLPIKYVGRD
jgi:hypothetical protein